MKLGIFWDIENVNIPKYFTPSYICNAIRNLEFASSCIEIKFIVACNVRKLDRSTIKSLIKRGVIISHVETAKNAADIHLIEQMKIYIETYDGNVPIKIILLTGDKDFGPFLRYIQEFHKNVKVLLIYPEKAVHSKLISLVHESMPFEGNINKSNEFSLVMLPITNLPNKTEEKKYQINTKNILRNMIKPYGIISSLIPFKEKIFIIMPKFNANLFRKKYANSQIGPRNIQILEYMDDFLMIGSSDLVSELTKEMPFWKYGLHKTIVYQR